MHVRLILPRLLWPDPAAAPALQALALPALCWLLGRAHATPLPGMSVEAALATPFNIDCGAAPLRRAGEEDALPAPASHWLCADPVCLHFARDQMVLSGPDALALSPEEAALLAPALQEALADVGTFTLPMPGRGYLQLPHATPADFSPLSDVAGRPVALFLPEGEAALQWGRIINTAQIVLHEHPVNRAREAEGRLLANSLWFWGHAATPTLATCPSPVFTDACVGRGLARLAGGTAHPLDALANAVRQSTQDLVILCEALHGPALYGDFTGWSERLATLEARIFAPLAAAMQSGHIQSVSLETHGERFGRHFHITRQRWAFWRKPRSLDLLATPS